MKFTNQSIQGLFKSEEVKIPESKIDYNLVMCDPKSHEGGCGLLQLDVTVPPPILYTQYFYRSSISNTMRDHLKQIVDDCLKFKTGYTQDKKVLDIASNDSYLLSCYPKDYVKFGIDPNNIAAENIKNLNICNDFFPSNAFDRFMLKWLYTNNYQESYQKCINKNKELFDIITCIAMMYDLHNPVNFIKEIEKYLNYDGIFVGEVAYLPEIIKNNDYSNFCLEHLTYFSLHTLEYLLKQANFKIFRVKLSPINGGVIQFWACKEETTKYNKKEWSEEIQKIRIEEFDKKLDDLYTFLNFRDKVQQHATDLFKILTELRLKGKKIHLLGASTKIEVVLNHAGIDNNLIDFASERTPQKWGMTTPGSNIMIISEEDSRKWKPDVYLCGIGWMQKEIVEREKEFLDNGGRLLFCFPKIVSVAKDRIDIFSPL